MEGGGGMVAVVRGLKDAGLAVTLLDGGRQYTLVPNGIAGSQVPPSSFTNKQMTTESYTDSTVHCDNSVQVTDGRYTSMYKTSHCNVTPSSPFVELTEFPPQRAELSPGHGNFVVGGSGSGETYYTPTKVNGFYRGGMSWPDRGSVCSPRPSREPDAFANSLRKYPSISPERSTEIMERLITYTQAKNLTKSQGRCVSPTRNLIDSDTSNLVVSQRNCKNISSSNLRNYEDVKPTYKSQRNEDITSKLSPREAPTKENTNKRGMNECGNDYRRNVGKTNDVKHDDETSKRAGDEMRNIHILHTVILPLMLHSTVLSSNENIRRVNSVNIEIQAAVEMESKEMATVPRAEPLRRTVAVPLTPTSSEAIRKSEGAVSHKLSNTLMVKNKSKPEIDYNAKHLNSADTSSSIELANHSCNYESNRKAKSDEDLRRKKDVEEEIIKLLEYIANGEHSDTTANLLSDVLDDMQIKFQKFTKDLSSTTQIEKVKNKVRRHEDTPDGISYSIHNFNDAKEVVKRLKHNRFKNHNAMKLNKSEMKSFRKSSENIELEDIVKKWVDDLPFKDQDLFDKQIRKYKLDIFMTSLLKLISNKCRINSHLKTEICSLLNEMPFEINGCNKGNYLCKQVDNLISRIKNTSRSNFDVTNIKRSKEFEDIKIPASKSNTPIQLNHEIIKQIVVNELYSFFQKFNIKINTKLLMEVEFVITNILIKAINNNDNINNMKKDLMSYLNSMEGVFFNKGTYFINSLYEHLKYINYKVTSQTTGSNNNIHNYVILQNTVSNAKEQNTYTATQYNNVTMNKNSSTSVTNKHSNLDAYMNELCFQIDEWLTILDVHIPLANESIFRQVAVKDLAGDIIDRYKYLELNPSSRVSDKEELEQLKYQIFKWINKLVGENNTETIKHASALMQRIQNIPVPVNIVQLNYNGINNLNNSKEEAPFGNNECPNSNISKRVNKSVDRETITHLNQATSTHNIKPNQKTVGSECQNIQEKSYNNKTNQAHEIPVSALQVPCCPDSSSLRPSSPSLKQINEDYDVFLRNWIKGIPVIASSAEEAEKAKIGIYNGIWKAITKLKFEPTIFYNQFYYEDVLEREIEELLSCLPQTPELLSKKELLKAKLLEKTTNTNHFIMSTAAPSSFKQHLIENVTNNIRGTVSTKDDDPKKLYEDLQIIRLVEYYILCTRFKDEDKVKTMAYRNKLLKEVEVLVNSLKKTHGKDLKDINPDLYFNDILNALLKVSLPSDDTIKEEADEIQLGLDIEQWLSDLPMQLNDSYLEQLQRKRLREALAKKIHEMQKNTPIDCSAERALKHEISKFLEKVPLQQGESLNINFMVDELTNRIKNRAAEPNVRKSVTFQETSFAQPQQNQHHYNPFPSLQSRRQSMYDNAVTPRNRNNSQVQFGSHSNSLIHDIPPYYVFDNERPVSSSFDVANDEEQWLTLQNSQEPYNPCLRNESHILPNSQTSHLQNRAPNNKVLNERSFYNQRPVPQTSSNHITQHQSLNPERSSRNNQILHDSTVGNVNNQGRVSQPVVPDIQINEGTIYVNKKNNAQFQSPAPKEMQYLNAYNSYRPTNQRQVSNQTGNIPGGISTYGQPQGFSTPQQGIPQESPKVARKRQRSHRACENIQGRRLELEEMDTDEELKPRLLENTKHKLNVHNNQEQESAGKSTNFKSVQTAFSSIDLKPENCFQCCRTSKTKSNEIVNKNVIETSIQEEVLEWFQDYFTSNTKADAWKEKLKRYSQI
ncbi:uncharacterized protein LOC131852195 [Achroia grisella]|uniref:uncharacterized protein LOC131852195 n=1 Tax=Achroia grisella TaxID=688607 RepID=UPI0027D2C99E|nr:uncharacterized protein LOC131852195 [Achroia grisella]